MQFPHVNIFEHSTLQPEKSPQNPWGPQVPIHSHNRIQMRIRQLLILIAAIQLTACGALHNARPLEQGEHRAGVTMGGAVLTQMGAPIPLPNMVLEGQSGVKALRNHATDVNYGMNLTALAFGVVGIHAGTSHLLFAQKGARPSLSATERIHFYNNWLDTTKDSSVRTSYLLNQVDLTAAWNINRHLGYVGISDYIDIPDPELNVAPFVGFVFQGKKKCFSQVEARYLAANRQPDIVDVSFMSFGEKGALSTTLSFGWNFGGASTGGLE